ncbi:serine hydrolase domain-containing protein [Solicola gregarius]|uniref:Beta-lactamase family protein n=1 Tax=Solicola gregarius TaxID=2908642 RepID=A0AA46YKC1_9ACTN|nr:serine hydrolase domain-containing protein [Solicola gregarius]UYM03823.1 beta-lactamase family protein [Solicola gregarius]
MRRTLVTAALAIALVAPVAAPAQSAPDDPHVATQESLDALRSDWTAPGGVVVAGDRDDEWTVSSGTAAIGQDRPITATDKFRVGSLTKTFTASIVLQLVDEGEVDLDEPIETYLPGVVQGANDGTEITVRNLLQHTSGIPDYLQIERMLDPRNQFRPHTLAEIASWGLEKPSEFEPGTEYRYSNTNYIVAGMLIEKVTGRSYDQELNDRIIGPLGLTDTYLPEPQHKQLVGPQVRGYFGQQFAYLDVTELIEPSMGLSGGGIVSTGADVAAFMQALADGTVVPRPLLPEMRTPNDLPGSAPKYGLGVDEFELPCGGVAYGHYGIWPGYQTIAAATDDGRHAFVGMNVLNFADGSAGMSGREILGRANTMVTALCDNG